MRKVSTTIHELRIDAPLYQIVMTWINNFRIFHFFRLYECKLWTSLIDKQATNIKKTLKKNISDTFLLFLRSECIQSMQICERWYKQTWLRNKNKEKKLNWFCFECQFYRMLLFTYIFVIVPMYSPSSSPISSPPYSYSSSQNKFQWFI